MRRDWVESAVRFCNLARPVHACMHCNDTGTAHTLSNDGIAKLYERSATYFVVRDLVDPNVNCFKTTSYCQQGREISADAKNYFCMLEVSWRTSRLFNINDVECRTLGVTLWRIFLVRKARWLSRFRSSLNGCRLRARIADILATIPKLQCDDEALTPTSTVNKLWTFTDRKWCYW